MRLLIRYFFKLVQAILGPLLLLWNWLTPPRGIKRAPEEQALVDARTRNLTLYQFRSCPFCIKVRRAMRRLSLNIETRDALRDPEARRQLLEGGGEVKVPCLKIVDEQGHSRWMYESSDIIRYLEQEIAGSGQVSQTRATETG